MLQFLKITTDYLNTCAYIYYVCTYVGMNIMLWRYVLVVVSGWVNYILCSINELKNIFWIVFQRGFSKCQIFIKRQKNANVWKRYIYNMSGVYKNSFIVSARWKTLLRSDYFLFLFLIRWNRSKKWSTELEKSNIVFFRYENVFADVFSVRIIIIIGNWKLCFPKFKSFPSLCRGLWIKTIHHTEMEYHLKKNIKGICLLHFMYNIGSNRIIMLVCAVVFENFNVIFWFHLKKCFRERHKLLAFDAMKNRIIMIHAVHFREQFPSEWIIAIFDRYSARESCSFNIA